MPIFMEVLGEQDKPDIEGDVSAQLHQNWIAIDTCSVKIKSDLESPKDEGGEEVDAWAQKSPKLEAVSITKRHDSSTADFMTWAVSNEKKSRVTVEVCEATGECYVRYILQRVSLDECKFSLEEEDKKIITLQLQCEKLEMQQRSIPKAGVLKIPRAFDAASYPPK